MLAFCFFVKLILNFSVDLCSETVRQLGFFRSLEISIYNVLVHLGRSRRSLMVFKRSLNGAKIKDINQLSSVCLMYLTNSKDLEKLCEFG